MKWHLRSEDGNQYTSYCGFKLMKPGASKRTVSVVSLADWNELGDMIKCKRCKKKYKARNRG